jgi:hypothetical protein
MNNYPFTITFDLDSFPKEVRTDIANWQTRKEKEIHEGLMRSDFVYRQAFERWQKEHKNG